MKELTFYLPLEVKTLEKVVQSFQEKFDQDLEDLFSEEELAVFEKQLDAIGAVVVQPILSELSFDDFYFHDEQEKAQRFFFDNCRSSLLIENLPFLETNPFQVSYLRELAERFDDFLVDQGGVSEIGFKKDFLEKLSQYKSMDDLLPQEFEPKIVQNIVSAPVDPIDFLVLDVYREIDRLKDQKLPVDELDFKTRKIHFVMSGLKADASTIYQKSGLGAKDFDDHLEKLKFWLKKL